MVALRFPGVTVTKARAAYAVMAALDVVDPSMVDMRLVQVPTLHMEPSVHAEVAREAETILRRASRAAGPVELGAALIDLMVRGEVVNVNSFLYAGVLAAAQRACGGPLYAGGKNEAPHLHGSGGERIDRKCLVIAQTRLDVRCTCDVDRLQKLQRRRESEEADMVAAHIRGAELRDWTTGSGELQTHWLRRVREDRALAEATKPHVGARFVHVDRNTGKPRWRVLESRGCRVAFPWSQLGVSTSNRRSWFSPIPVHDFTLSDLASVICACSRTTHGTITRQVAEIIATRGFAPSELAMCFAMLALACIWRFHAPAFAHARMRGPNSPKKQPPSAKTSSVEAMVLLNQAFGRTFPRQVREFIVFVNTLSSTWFAAEQGAKMKRSARPKWSAEYYVKTL